MSKNNEKQKEFNLYDLGFTDEMIEQILNEVEKRNITLDEYMNETLRKYLEQEERIDRARLKMLKKDIKNEKQHCKKLRQLLQMSEERLNKYEKEYNELAKFIEKKENSRL